MLFLSVFNTDGQTKDSLSYSFSGFVRFDYWNDTRVNDEAVEGLFSLVPSQKVFDSYGNDLNERSSANALALASRIKLVAAGVKIFGANTSSFLEADFTGTSGSSRVRFRHELDAASNNSVEDIRTLIDKVRIPPQVGRYSVYIIDEVHMW